VTEQRTGASNLTIEAPIDGCYHSDLWFPVFAGDGVTVVGWGCHGCGWHTFYPDDFWPRGGVQQS
jgi:hypothetical protein